MFNDAPAILNNIELFFSFIFLEGSSAREPSDLETWWKNLLWWVWWRSNFPKTSFAITWVWFANPWSPNLLMLRWIKISCINMHQSSEELTSIKCSNTESMFDFPAVFCPGKYITIASYYHPYPEKVYHLAREALLQGGPIPAYLYADSGFMAYGGGIYTHGCDSSANHAITVVGYGPDYWNCCLVEGWEEHLGKQRIWPLEWWLNKQEWQHNDVLWGCFGDLLDGLFWRIWSRPQVFHVTVNSG